MFETAINDSYAITDEFQVGQTIFQNQSQSELRLEGLAGGGFVAVWTGEDGYNDLGVRAQLFDSDGQPLGGEFGVNSATAGVESQPAVTALPSGGFVVTWSDGSGAGFHIHGQTFDAKGIALGSEFVADLIGSSAGSSDVTALNGGGFVVTWDSGVDIRAQLFGVDGSKIGSNFVASDAHGGDKGDASVVALTGGGFVVSWFDPSADVEDSFGNLGPGSRAQIFDASGTKIGNAFALNSFVVGSQQNPTIASLPNRGFVAAYADTGIDNLNNATGHGGIWVQLFDANGNRVGAEIHASGTAVQSQYMPDIEIVPGTGFLVVWRDGAGSGLYDQATQIHAQMFDFNGALVGSEFSLDTSPGESQNSPDLAYLSNGALVVGWQNLDAPSYNDLDVRARMLFPITHGTSGNDVFNGSANRDFYMGDGGDDIIHGQAGDDMLVGGAGNDQLYGDAGNDTLDGGTGFDTADYSQEHGAGDVFVNLSANAITNGSGLIGPFSVRDTYGTLDVLTSIEHVITGAGNDTFVGSTANDFFEAGAGNDTLDGGAGADTLTGGAGVDVLTGGAGNDTFRDTTAGLSGDTITDFSAGDRIVITDANPAGFTFSLSGNVLNFTGGSLTLGSVPSGTITARDTAGGGVELTIVQHHPANDFNGDGISDVLWRNDDGRITDWLGTSSGSLADTNAYRSVGADWEVAATGDFSGDKLSDILWRNADGRVTTWFGTASGLFADTNTYRAVGTDWHIAGSADIDGDGISDVVWRNDDGRITLWMGTTTGSFADTNTYRAVGTDWQVAGLGDFNGDGRADMLWHNADGRVTLWMGNANGGFDDTNAYRSVDTQWQVAGIGDFNGDGIDDLLWRNTDGRVTEWLGTGSGSFSDTNSYRMVDPAWQVAGIGDFEGDHHDDILWRNSDGRVTIWQGVASGTFSDTNLYRTVDTHWHPEPNSHLLG